jgi:hypothetical protein
MKALCALDTIELSSAASLVDSSLEKNFGIEWVRLMGLKSLRVLASGFFGISTTWAEFRRLKC